MTDTLMHRSVVWLKTHRVAFIGAIVTGMLMAGPQWWFAYSLGSEYRGINMMGSDAESHYLARMHEVLEGNGVGNPYFFEEKGEVPTSQYLAVEYLLVAPAYVLGIPVATLNLGYKFLFAFGIFLAAYLLTFRLVHRRSAALAAAALMTLGPTLFSIAQIKNLFAWNTTAYDGFAMYSRPVNPAVSTLWFLVYLHLLLSWWRGIEGKTQTRLLIGLAGMFAFSFYLYFYTWTFLTVVNGLFGLLVLVTRDWRRTIEIAAVSIFGFVAAVPYFLNTLAFTSHAYFPDISKTFLILYTHAPRFTLSGFACVAVFALGVYLIGKTIARREWIFIALLLASAFIAINQQIITGTLIQEGHYHWYYNIPVFSFALVFGVVLIAMRFGFSRLVPYWSFVVICISLASTVLIQTASYSAWYDHTTTQQRYAEVFEWLDTHADPEDVVLASNDLSELIPVYTNQNVLWSDYAFTYLIPRVRVEHALFVYLTLHGISPEALPESAFHPPTVDGESAYEYRETAVLLGDKKGYLIGFYGDGMAKKYEAFASADPLERLQKYRLDYVILDRSRYPHWETTLPPLTEVFRTDSLTIFALPS